MQLRKKVTIGVAAAGLVVAGAGSALAASSGYMSVSTNGAYVNNGYYTFYGRKVGSQWNSQVSGTLVVTTATDHLNARPDGYGYAKLVQANSTGKYNYNYYLGTGDVLVSDPISLQVCREHWYGDDCASKTVYR